MPAGLVKLAKTLRWKLIHRGRRRDVTMETWNGLLTWDSKDWLIGKYLYVNRSYERSNIENTLALLHDEGYVRRPGRTMLDIGANIGMIAIALLNQGYFEKALAFEPDPNNYRLLDKNTAQNGLGSRIAAYPIGLSSPGSGAAVLERSPDNFGDHRIRWTNDSGFFGEERRATLPVRLASLDEFFHEHAELDPGDVDLVWIDIQGHEGYFFGGARDFFKRRVPVVSEFWPYGLARSGMKVPEYLEIVRSLFTHFYWWTNGGFQKKPVGELDGLFELHAKPRAGDQVILVRH